jgi:tellurite resistance protein TehA-like permease
MANYDHRMSNRRKDLAEMTALYLIPIVAIVIAATSGGLVARALTNNKHQLWTLVISYIFWGIGTPLSWIILTMYFIRMTIHKPLEREVIVSLLLPIGPLGLSGFSYVKEDAVFRTCCTRLLTLFQDHRAWKGSKTQLPIDGNTVYPSASW